MSKLTQLIDQATTDYAKYLDAGTSYGASMRALAKALGGTPCPTALGQLAKVHAEKYQCNYTWDGKGRAVFFNGEKSTRETRNDAARKSWSRNVMVWFTPERDAKPAKSMRLSRDVRDAAKAYLAMFGNVNEAIKALRAVA
jgi:hypothetical protein